MFLKLLHRFLSTFLLSSWRIYLEFNAHVIRICCVQQTLSIPLRMEKLRRSRTGYLLFDPTSSVGIKFCKHFSSRNVISRRLPAVIRLWVHIAFTVTIDHFPLCILTLKSAGIYNIQFIIWAYWSKACLNISTGFNPRMIIYAFFFLRTWM